MYRELKTTIEIDVIVAGDTEANAGDIEVLKRNADRLAITDVFSLGEREALQQELIDAAPGEGPAVVDSCVAKGDCNA